MLFRSNVLPFPMPERPVFRVPAILWQNCAACTSVEFYPPYHVILEIYIPLASNFPVWNSELRDPNHPLGWTNTLIHQNLDLTNATNELYQNLSNASNNIFSATTTPGFVLIEAAL